MNCQNKTIWYEERLIDPKTVSIAQGPIDHSLIESELKLRKREKCCLFLDAPSVLSCFFVFTNGQTGKNLTTTYNLVSQDCFSETQKGLDFVRVTGNDAVHPNDLAGGDTQQIAIFMFEVVNSIVDDLFAKHTRFEIAYESLPSEAKDAIDKKDR